LLYLQTMLSSVVASYPVLTAMSRHNALRPKVVFFSLDMRITYDGRIIKQNVSLQQECLAIPTVSLSIIKPKFSIFFSFLNAFKPNNKSCTIHLAHSLSSYFTKILFQSRVHNSQWNDKIILNSYITFNITCFSRKMLYVPIYLFTILYICLLHKGYESIFSSES